MIGDVVKKVVILFFIIFFNWAIGIALNTSLTDLSNLFSQVMFVIIAILITVLCAQYYFIGLKTLLLTLYATSNKTFGKVLHVTFLLVAIAMTYYIQLVGLIYVALTLLLFKKNDSKPRSTRKNIKKN